MRPRAVCRSRLALGADTMVILQLLDETWREWRDDPECTVVVPNPFGTHNAVRQVN